MGMFTAIMGGVIRDMMINELPIVFRKEIYATACLAGAVLYVVLDVSGMDRTISFFTAGTVIVLIRLAALRYNLSIPSFKSH